HQIIGVAHDNHVASGLLPSPAFGMPVAAPTSTRVSLKQAPSAMSARVSAETSAEIVCPVRLVDSQAPFSLATTPRGTLSLICNGKITSPRSFHTLTSPAVRPRVAASSGCIINGGAFFEPPMLPRVEEMRLSDAGEISI